LYAILLQRVVADRADHLGRTPSFSACCHYAVITLRSLAARKHRAGLSAIAGLLVWLAVTERSATRRRIHVALKIFFYVAITGDDASPFFRDSEPINIICLLTYV